MPPHPVPARPTECVTLSNSHTISILLWNVWLLPPPLSDTIVGSRAQRISPLLTNHDIVILNEAFTYKSQLLSQTNYPYQAVLKRKRVFDLFDSGIILLSAHPIIKLETEHFRTRRKWDRLASKGIIFSRIKVPGGEEIDIYATHMQAGHSDSEQSSRDQQTRQLCEFIRRNSLLEENRRVVLVGDMNMGPARNVDLSGYSVHYSSPLDAQRRVGTYEMLKRETGLRDVVCPGWEQDINRFLVKEIESAVVEYLEKPQYDKRRSLSDSERLICHIRFPPNERMQNPSQ